MSYLQGIHALAMALGVALISPLSDVQAQSYPEKAVRLIVPFTAGGGADNLGRIIGEHMQKSLGQPFIVDNRPGGGANIGHEIVARAAPDGYTLIVATNSLPINQSLYKNLQFNAIGSFTPIILLATSPIVIGGRASLPVNSMAEVITYAKKDRLTFSSCGVASIYHMVGERINAAAGTKIAHIPYKGCSQALPDVLGGQVDLFVNALPNVLPLIKSGKLKVFAVTETQRTPLAPEIATFSEATGLPTLSAQGWYSIMGPAGLPLEVVAKINRAANDALASAEVRLKLRSQLYDIKGGTPQELAHLIKSDMDAAAQVIKSANIQPE